MPMISSKQWITSNCRRVAAMLVVAAIALSTALSPVDAQERAVALDKPRLAQAPEPLCFCWSDGRKIAEGSIACIKTTMGRRLAACGRVINMMSWEVTDNPCPES